MSAPAPPMMMMPDPSALNLSCQVSNTRADLLNSGANNTSAVLQSGSGDTQAVLQTVNADTAQVIAATERQSYHTQAAVDRSSYNAGAATQAGFFESRGLMAAGAIENRQSTNLNGVEGRALLNNSFFETRNSLNNGFTANLLAAKDAQLAIAISEGRVRNEISEVAGILGSKISVSREALAGQIGAAQLQNQVELSKYFAISERENNKQFALATLAASTNAAKIQSDVANCCCEVQAVVNSTANATQALVQANETNRVRDELASSQQENLYLRLRAPVV